MRPHLALGVLGAVLVALLVAGHLFAAALIASRLALPAAVVVVVIVAALAVHLGLLSPVVAWLRRRAAPRGD